MNCPQCNHPNSKVNDSRTNRLGRYRRRQCDACSHRYTTQEIVIGRLIRLSAHRESQIRSAIKAMQLVVESGFTVGEEGIS